jgi:hypothetical protein
LLIVIERLIKAILLRQADDMVEAAKSIRSDIFLLMLCNIPNPKWFVL